MKIPPLEGWRAAPAWVFCQVQGPTLGPDSPCLNRFSALWRPEEHGWLLFRRELVENSFCSYCFGGLWALWQPMQAPMRVLAPALAPSKSFFWIAAIAAALPSRND